MSAADPHSRVAEDIRLMRLALAIGRRSLGRTWPNPAVGAVVVEGRSGRILGTGATQPGGRPHAEPLALAEAGPAARGATIYVSLEPCSHHGRTPPCAEGIITAGVGRLVTALTDPDERVAGRGHALIRVAGGALTTGVEAETAARDHRGHVLRIREGRPAVMLKLARTRDGYAARRSGSRLLITGEGANARTHMARARSDAVMVGVSTVLADDPRLDVRLPGLEARSPLPVVLDSRLRLPAGSRLLAGGGARPPWILCTDAAEPAAEHRLAGAGAVVKRVEAGPDGRVDLSAALRRLAGDGLTRIFCEGGPTLAEALAAADLVDEMMLITGGQLLGEAGLPAIGPELARTVAAFATASDETVGPDRVTVLERPIPCSPGS